MSAAVDAARGYDRWFDQPWNRYAFRIELAALLDALEPLDGRDVLDVGCGTGRFTAALEAAGPYVTGVDRDAGMLTSQLNAWKDRGCAPMPTTCPSTTTGSI